MAKDWTMYCFFCEKPLDVGGIHGMFRVSFCGKPVCSVFSCEKCLLSGRDKIAWEVSMEKKEEKTDAEKE